MNAPHLPGIEASSLPSLRHPRSGFFHQSRNSDLAFLPENPSPGQRRKVRQRGCPRSIADRMFFTTHTPIRQSWRGHRIAPSILLW